MKWIKKKRNIVKIKVHTSKQQLSRILKMNWKNSIKSVTYIIFSTKSFMRQITIKCIHVEASTIQVYWFRNKNKKSTWKLEFEKWLYSIFSKMKSCSKLHTTQKSSIGPEFFLPKKIGKFSNKITIEYEKFYEELLNWAINQCPGVLWKINFPIDILIFFSNFSEMYFLE